MTLADFLHQAGFWQWLGMIILVGVAAHGLGRFRLWGNNSKTKNVYMNKEKP